MALNYHISRNCWIVRWKSRGKDLISWTIGVELGLESVELEWAQRCCKWSGVSRTNHRMWTRMGGNTYPAPDRRGGENQRAWKNRIKHKPKQFLFKPDRVTRYSTPKFERINVMNEKREEKRGTTEREVEERGEVICLYSCFLMVYSERRRWKLSHVCFPWRRTRYHKNGRGLCPTMVRHTH